MKIAWNVESVLQDVLLVLENPQATDELKCLACGRCIIECAVGARNFSGEFFEARAVKFQDAFSVPKANEMYYAEINIL